MKQLLLLLSFLPLSYLNAQITISSDDIKPLNVVAFQAEDDGPDASILPGGTGEQTWDFTALSDADGTLEFSFVDPSTTPYTAEFPNSNIASVEDMNYFYLTQTDNELTLDGTFGDFEYNGFTVTTLAKITPPQTYLKFPATNGDSFTETIEQSAQGLGSDIGLPFDSVRLVRTVVRTVTIDAYGMITTPLGTFEAIRSTENEVSSGELLALSAGVWSSVQPLPSDEQNIYNWWTQDGNFGFPVVQLQTDDAGAVTGANWVTDFVSSSEEVFDLQFSLYPNPAPSEFVVEFPEFFNGSIEVVNLNGQTVLQKVVSNQKENITTDKMVSGSYILLVKNETGKMTAAKRFEVIK